MGFSIRATARFIPISPRKVRLVADAVRGMPTAEALALLRLTPKAAARPVSKLIASAVANARETYGLEADDLYVAEIAADGGPSQRRGRWRARGRFGPLLKRSCHIRVALRECPSAVAARSDTGTRSKKGEQ